MNMLDLIYNEIGLKVRNPNYDFRKTLNESIYMINAQDDYEEQLETFTHIVDTLYNLDNVFEYNESIIYLENDSQYSSIKDIEKYIITQMYNYVSFNDLYDGLIIIEVSQFSKKNFIDVLKVIKRIKDHNLFMIVNHTPYNIDLDFIKNIELGGQNNV